MSSWTEADKIRAEHYAMTTLGEVGVPIRTVVETGMVALHWRRMTTQRERDYVAKTTRWKQTRQ